MRRRWLARLAAVLVLSVVAVAAVALSDTGDDDGCAPSLDLAAWERPGAARLRQARRLDECDTLTGRTRAEAVALLGTPDRVAPGALVYALGPPGATLRVRLARGRVSGATVSG